ncbi:MAG: metallophosphoesterase [Saprospiraceae bacterium]|nr:metallophosphoesterase [Saprospiraceae bacterium]
MKFIPHDSRAANYLNALEDAHDKSTSDKNNTLNHVENYLEKWENTRKDPETIDEKLAHLGMKLSHAASEGDAEQVKKLESEFQQLAEQHPQSTLMKSVTGYMKNHSVPGYDYRNWKDHSSGLQFGMIKATLDDDATIGIIGDWGTGDPDAQALLQEMKDDFNPDIYIHLGDIYRSCRYHKDVLPNFINIFDAVYPPVNGKPTRPPILTIAGNHDYMSNGGYGFFKLLDTVNAHHPSWKQEASYFCLRTKSNKWQFLGADTGINDPSYTHKNEHPGLEPDEYTWHYDKLKNFTNKGKGRTIFMTHHPLFSATHRLQENEYVNHDLAQHFCGYMKGGSVQPDEIRLWLWGHNHWFIPYVNTAIINPSPGVSGMMDKGRLLGGSARHDYHTSSEIVKSGQHVINYQDSNGNNKPLVPDFNNNLPNHTYAIMKLSDADAEITYYQTPAWQYNDNNPVKKLPGNQHRVLLREYVLNTKPSQKYVKQ